MNCCGASTVVFSSYANRCGLTKLVDTHLDVIQMKVCVRISKRHETSLLLMYTEGSKTSNFKPCASLHFIFQRCVPCTVLHERVVSSADFANVVLPTSPFLVSLSFGLCSRFLPIA